MAPAGSHQLLAQDPEPVRRCGAEERTGYQAREGVNGDRNIEWGGGRNAKEDGDEHEDRDGGGNGNGNGGVRGNRVREPSA